MDFDSHNPVVSSEENELEDDNQVLLGSVQQKKVQFQPAPPQNQRINHQTPQRFVPMQQQQQQQQQFANQWNQPQPLQQQHPYNQHVQMPQQQQPYYPQIVQQPQFDMNTYEPQLQQHTVQFPPTEDISPRRIGRKRPLSSKFITILVLHLIAMGASNLMYGLLFTFLFLLCLASSIIGFIAAKKKSISAHGVFIGISIVEIFIFGFLFVLAFPLWAGGFSTEEDRYQRQNNSYENRETHVHVFVFIGYALFVLAGLLKFVAVAQSFKLIKMIKKEMSIQENIQINTNGTVPRPQYIHNPQFTVPMNVQPQQYIPQQQQLQFPQQFGSQNVSSAPIDEESQPSLDQLQNQFSNEVRLLSEMGFDNTERNLYLLHKNNGNIQSVVQDYIKNY